MPAVTCSTSCFFFFFQAEDGIRDLTVTGVQTCALPICAEANMAKHLAAKASWEAANVCLQTHGGFGFAAEYDVERKFRETRLYLVAPKIGRASCRERV